MGKLSKDDIHNPWSWGVAIGHAGVDEACYREVRSAKQIVTRIAAPTHITESSTKTVAEGTADLDYLDVVCRVSSTSSLDKPS